MLLEWDPSTNQKRNWDTVQQSVNLFGAIIGSLSCATLLNHGKFKLIMLVNGLLTISIGVCMVENMYVIFVGRFLWGLTQGAFPVICAKYNNEICPVEFKGPFGAISQLMLTFGVMLPSSMALAIPSPPSPEDRNTFVVAQYWRLIWLTPVFVAIVQVCLMKLVFNHETPVFLHQKGRDRELEQVLGKFYEASAIRERLERITGFKDTFLS